MIVHYTCFSFSFFLIWAFESTIWRKSAVHTTRLSSSSQALSFLSWHLSLGWIFISSLFLPYSFPPFPFFLPPFLLPSYHPFLLSFLFSFFSLFHPFLLLSILTLFNDAGKKMKTGGEGMTEDEMVGWHHRLNGHEFEQAPGGGDGQGSLARCSPWGRKESDMTERLNWSDPYPILPFVLYFFSFFRSIFVLYLTVDCKLLKTDFFGLAAAVF